VPVVIERGERCFLYDIDGKRYFDYICGFASVGQGHCHPKIVEALVNQATKVTQYSRTFFGTELSTFSK
jgi:ornithine--oxo-acid transaminase